MRDFYGRMFVNFSQTASGARGPQYCASQLMNINDARTTFLWRSLINIHEPGVTR